MYETIVVGFDGSYSSRAALIEASNWIKRHGGKLFLVHAVYFDSEEFGIAPEQLEKRLKLGEKICIQTKEMITSEFGIEAQYLLCEGEPPEVIADVAAGKKADLIVLGTYGRRGLNRILMGSVTSQVIANSPTDVLVVKKPCDKCAGEYKSVLVPFDGSEFSKNALNRACQLSKIDSAEITVMYVIPRYEEMVEFFMTASIRSSLFQEGERIVSGAVSLSSTHGITVNKEIVEGNPAEKILESAKKMKNDLIVMGSHGHRGISKAIIGSTTEEVIIHASCPILVVR